MFEVVMCPAGNTSNISLNDIVAMALSNPKVAIAIVVEIVLGVAPGYVMARMARYLLAFIALLIIGAILNVWSLGETIEGFLVKVGVAASQFKDVVLGFISTLGLLMTGPVTLGFFTGLIIGLLRK